MEKFVLQLAVMCCIATRAISMTTVYMDDHCNKTFIVDDSVRIVSSRGDYLRARTSCNIFLMSNSKETNELVHIRTFNITCAQGFLTLYDGKGIVPNNIVALGLCGQKSRLPLTVFNSTLHGFTLALTTDNWNFHGGFDILVTSYFKDGPCSVREYECSNKWCIARNLHCDGYDNCGNASDETHCSGGGARHSSSSYLIMTVFLFLFSISQKLRT
ncbi:neuropilin and tolloid-like protein 1 [Ylistrum balloti]|uniref:neuropilin and tolloid-like protein 1 n=1 Tax=Ylistrum balloti TaxID=509963 RepID=UPI002905ED24|nr:neuropilin and tolloid-like protein 1 [Ylistrum balloti]